MTRDIRILNQGRKIQGKMREIIKIIQEEFRKVNNPKKYIP